MRTKHPICYDPKCELHTTPETNVTLRMMFPRASIDFLAANAVQPILKRKKGKIEANDHREVSHPVPQHHQTPALDRADEGETSSLGRVAVRFIGYRVRPLDPDNFAGSTKDLLDGCVKAGLLAGDEWWRITLETRQEKVKSYEEEKTTIEIEYP